MTRLRGMLKVNRSDCGKQESLAEKYHKKYSAAGERWNVACITTAEEPRNHEIAGCNSGT